MWGETSGRVKASELKPESFGKKLGEAEDVLFVLGSEVGLYPEEVLKEMIEKVEPTVFKTESAGSEDIDVDADARYGLMEIADRLCNKEDESYEYVILAGIPYHIETRVLAGLRSYGVDVVVTLNWRHQQYADISFNNLPRDKWESDLKALTKQI